MPDTADPGKNGNLFRPSLTLYFKLKLGRASESDILDCLSFLNWYEKNKLPYDKKELLDVLAACDAIKVSPLVLEINRFPC